MTLDNDLSELSELSKLYLKRVRSEIYSIKTRDLVKADKTLFKIVLKHEEMLEHFVLDGYLADLDRLRSKIVQTWKTACYLAIIDESNVQ